MNWVQRKLKELKVPSNGSYSSLSKPATSSPPIAVPLPTSAQPHAEETVDFEVAIPNVAKLNTKIPKEASGDVAKILAGAGAAIMGVVVTIVLRGKRF